MELIETSEWCARRTDGAFREGVWLSAWLELKLEKTEYWEERVMTIRLNGSVSTIALVLAASFLGIAPAFAAEQEIGSASCRERVCQYVYISVVAGTLKTNTYTKNKT